MEATTPPSLVPSVSGAFRPLPASHGGHLGLSEICSRLRSVCTITTVHKKAAYAARRWLFGRGDSALPTRIPVARGHPWKTVSLAKDARRKHKRKAAMHVSLLVVCFANAVFRCRWGSKAYSVLGASSPEVTRSCQQPPRQSAITSRREHVLPVVCSLDRFRLTSCPWVRSLVLRWRSWRDLGQPNRLRRREPRSPIISSATLLT